MSEGTFQLILTAEPTKADRQIVAAGLEAYNDLHAPPHNYTPLCIFIRDREGKVMGGLLGETYWGWLHIAEIWLHATIRKQGYGTRLIKMAEDEAVQRGCQQAHLDTMDWQALDFYLGMGYTVFGQLNDLPARHTRYFLQKSLSPADPTTPAPDRAV